MGGRPCHGVVSVLVILASRMLERAKANTALTIPNVPVLHIVQSMACFFALLRNS